MSGENDYRRSLDELLFRYQNNLEFRDVYVEGPRDMHFFSWFFSHFPDLPVVVYDIDTVDVSPTALMQFGASSSGNRGRVIALARFIEENSLECRMALRCIVDRDFDSDVSDDRACLIYTDYACLECYAASESQIRKLFALYFVKDISPQTLHSMFAILNIVFLTRKTKSDLAPDGQWFQKFWEFCAFEADVLTLNLKPYTLRVCTAAGMHGRVNDFEVKMSQLRLVEITDPRLAIQGHDLICLLSWLARKKNVPLAICSDKNLQSALFTAVDITTLRSEPLFKKLVDWASA